jgi:hypothetical protein
MIHHFARALAIRETRAEAKPASTAPSVPSQAAPIVRPLPLAVPRAPARPPADTSRHNLRIHRHPSDVRRTVIAGRFAEVCAALERLAAEPEAA